MILADDLLTFFVKSSVEEQDVWLRDAMLKNGGLLAIRVDSVLELRDGVILTPYRSSGTPVYHSRILFKDTDHPIVAEHAEHRAAEITGDLVFAARYARYVTAFRHYTDATVIRLVHALYKRTLEFKGPYTIDATKVVQGLMSIIPCPIKPDFRRSVYAIKIVKMMTGGKVDVNDRLWIRAHQDLVEYMKLEKHFSTILDEGFCWYQGKEETTENSHSVIWRTAGLSALSCQEVELRFKLLRTDPRAVGKMEDILNAVGDILKKDVVRFGMETLDMKRTIKHIIKSHVNDLSYCERDNYDALVSSVYPRKSMAFTVILK